jgi:hypothetical protein
MIDFCRSWGLLTALRTQIGVGYSTGAILRLRETGAV